ncbi:hypothetical protein [Desulfobacter sp.]
MLKFMTLSTVLSRWENNKQDIDKSNDRLVRLVYANMKGIPQEEIRNFLKEIIREIGRREQSTNINISVDSLIAKQQSECNFC